MLSTTTQFIINKVISHIYYIYVTSQLLKKRFGCKLFAINLYFNSSQYYPTLDKTLALKLSLHLICFILRLYPCISLISDFYFAFVNKCDGVVINKYHKWIKCTSKCFKDNNKASHFIPQLWITLSDHCQTLKKNSNSADLCHLYLLGAKLHQHLHQ